MRRFNLYFSQILMMEEASKSRFLLVLLAVLLPLFLTAQDQATATYKEGIIKVDDDYFADALVDFKKGEARLFCQGGLSPTVDRRMEKRFQKKYKLGYHDIGCMSADDSLVMYNFAVFELLDFKYGIKWQRLVRYDAIGLSAWRKKQANIDERH